MKHTYRLEGYCYRLRPVKLSDATFIVSLRLADAERNRFIHRISPDVSDQEAWLREYFGRAGDYYFLIENRLTGEAEGTISFYDEANGRAEWGRWVLRKGSLAAAESVYLLYRIAFEQAGLKELCCRTIEDNAAVVSFHTSAGERTRTVLKDYFELNGIQYNAVEQYSDRENFYHIIAPALERQAARILRRELKRRLGGMTFHHLGVATTGIEKELSHYTLLGYEREGSPFVDPLQGIRGQFLTAEGQPRLELLENLENSHTLDPQLERGQKLYHMAYTVRDIEKATALFQGNRAKTVSPLKYSVYFQSRVCFLMLPNLMMLELVEELRPHNRGPESGEKRGRAADGL